MVDAFIQFALQNREWTHPFLMGVSLFLKCGPCATQTVHPDRISGMLSTCNYTREPLALAMSMPGSTYLHILDYPILVICSTHTRPSIHTQPTHYYCLKPVHLHSIWFTALFQNNISTSAPYLSLFAFVCNLKGIITWQAGIASIYLVVCYSAQPWICHFTKGFGNITLFGC